MVLQKGDLYWQKVSEVATWWTKSFYTFSETWRNLLCTVSKNIYLRYSGNMECSWNNPRTPSMWWIDCGKVNVIFSETGGLGDKLERICSHQVYAGELWQEWGYRTVNHCGVLYGPPHSPLKQLPYPLSGFTSGPGNPAMLQGLASPTSWSAQSKFLYYEFFLVGFCHRTPSSHWLAGERRTGGGASAVCTPTWWAT